MAKAQKKESSDEIFILNRIEFAETFLMENSLENVFVFSSHDSALYLFFSLAFSIERNRKFSWQLVQNKNFLR